MLSKLDEKLLSKLAAGDIRLVRSAWLLQPSVTKMRKRQELETIEEQGAAHDVSPLLSCDEDVVNCWIAEQLTSHPK